MVHAAKRRSKRKISQKNSFLNKVNSHISEQNASHEHIEKLSSICCLLMIFKKAQRLMIKNTFSTDLCHGGQIALYLKLKILISYFENFSVKMNNVLGEFDEIKKMNYKIQSNLVPFELFRGKNFESNFKFNLM